MRLFIYTTLKDNSMIVRQLIKIIIISLSFNINQNLFGQMPNIRFNRIDINNGLPSNTVYAICRDSAGYIWIGGEGGLARFDGYKVKLFKPDYKRNDAIKGSQVATIFQDSKYRIWVCTTEAGIHLYNREKDSFKNYPTAYNAKANNQKTKTIGRSIIEDITDKIWCSGSNLSYYDPKTDMFIFFDNNQIDPYVNCLYADKEGTIWTGGLNSNISLINPHTHEVKNITIKSLHKTNFPSIRIQEIIEDRNNHFWLCTEKHGLLLFDKKSATVIKQFTESNSSLSCNDIREAIQNDDGKLWLATPLGGINIFDTEKETFICLRHNPLDRYSISTNATATITKDKLGTIWIGTVKGGVNYYTPEQKQFYLFNRVGTDDKSLSNSVVMAFTEDNRNRIYIGTDKGGLNRFTPETGEMEHFLPNDKNPNSISGLACISLATDKKGNVWAGCWGTGLNIMDTKTDRFKHYSYKETDPDGLGGSNVWSICVDKYDSVWLGFSNSIHSAVDFFDKKNNKFRHFGNNPDNPKMLATHLVLKVYKDNKENLWVSFIFGAVIILNPKTKTIKKYEPDPLDPKALKSGVVNDIFEGSKGRLWFATNEGLSKFNYSTETFFNYSVADGFPADRITSILEDDHGNLWLGTANGICKFNPDTKLIKNYTPSDGLQSKEFNGGSALKTKDGWMYFGGVQGFNYFHPDSIEDNPHPPVVVITDFSIFNKPVDFRSDSTVLKQPIDRAKEITLNYDQSVISFEYAGMTFVSNEKNQYAYKLEGFDNNWNCISYERKATYTNLNPGRYIFHAKGSNNDGVWNEEGVSLKITITPPFWQTAWFRVMGIILVFGVLISGYKIRTARIRTHNRELEQRVSERTAQLEVANKELEAFTYSVSHDLRAPLRAVDGYTNILAEDYEQLLDEKGKRMCAVICSETKRMGQLIDDLLSFSHISYAEMQVSSINMEALVSTVFQELTTLESRERIDFRVASLPSAIGDLTLIRQVWMNLLSNAIKFSSKRERALIEVGYQQDGQRTIYSVRDNGAGFDMQYADKLFKVFWRFHSKKEFEGTGVGLAIVQRLIHRHGGEVWAESHVDQGATFYFTIPIKGDT
jgi:signal transduction histidine kinase/ligand-binding sensor domain-containing protein